MTDCHLLLSQPPQRMSKSSLLEIPPDLVHSRIPSLYLHYTGECIQKKPMMILFVFFLSPTVQNEDVSLYKDLRRRQPTVPSVTTSLSFFFC